jgi:hypothetical protein
LAKQCAPFQFEDIATGQPTLWNLRLFDNTQAGSKAALGEGLIRELIGFLLSRQTRPSIVEKESSG